MTGELCDCFATKRRGRPRTSSTRWRPRRPRRRRPRLAHRRPVVNPATAARRRCTAAAANWLALATFAGRLAPRRPGAAPRHRLDDDRHHPPARRPAGAAGAAPTRSACVGRTGLHGRPADAAVRLVPRRGGRVLRHHAGRLPDAGRSRRTPATATRPTAGRPRGPPPTPGWRGCSAATPRRCRAPGRWPWPGGLHLLQVQMIDHAARRIAAKHGPPRH